ncbi:hypothetical protein Vadar_011625 [Vaccinium darrowii]|uniref:Uncharacterized protein n=1 Tax=Vaccinium darrowii TaxID=229202 RepID=A0ACB7X999_9ERIC|nr:hypothetical protein Vadar_011625 [Vaccinium darrowii]
MLQVTWVEHVEVDDGGVHEIYKPPVNYGFAFSAKRWTCILERQCERFASVLAIPPTDGRRSMLKLAERMVMSFFGGVSAAPPQDWTTIWGSRGDDTRVMMRKSINDPGCPSGMVICAATSFRLPVSQKRVFDFLRDDRFRTKVSQNEVYMFPDIYNKLCKFNELIANP